MFRIIAPLLLAACASLNPPPKSLDEVRALVESGVDPDTGTVFASSEAAAKEDTSTSRPLEGSPDPFDDVSGARRTDNRRMSKAWFRAEKRADGGVVVSIETFSSRVLMDAELDRKPSLERPSKPLPVWVGSPWRETAQDQTNYTDSCKGSRTNCTRVYRARISLSEADVRALLANQNGEYVRVAVGR